MKYVLPLVVALALVACGDAGAQSASDDLDGRWELVSGTTAEGEVPVVDGYDITLSIDGDQWGGTAACNSYGATVESGDELRITELSRTEMGCPDDGVMESEDIYLDAFGQVTSAQLVDDRLRLTSSDDEVELVYAPVVAEGSGG